MNTDQPVSPRDGERSDPGVLARAIATAQRHPMTIGILVVGGVIGAIGGYWLPVDRSLPTRILGGAIVGVWFALFPIGARLLQGDD